jgi:hypothetical protein
MVVSEIVGSITMDAAEDVLFDVTILGSYATKIDLTNMQSGDTITVRVYAKINGTLIQIYTFTYTGAQSPPGIEIPYISGLEYKVTAQQTAGVNRTLGWSRFSV